MKTSVFICASSLCCCLIVCALVRMISPTGATNKIMNVVISVFTLCCLFSPVSDLVSSFRNEEYKFNYDAQTEVVTGKYDESVVMYTTQYISEYISTVLTSAGIDVTQVKTRVGINEEKGIYISNVYIYLYEVTPSQKEEIENLIYSELMVKPVILESKYGE